jgi:hypothetical protein
MHGYSREALWSAATWRRFRISETRIIIPKAELAAVVAVAEHGPNWHEVPADESGANEKINH